MTPLEFERQHDAAWTELESLCRRDVRALEPERFLLLYRLGCEHLALAQARGFPDHVILRLAELTSRAHQIVYRQTDFGAKRIARVLVRRFPAEVRAHRRYVAAAALLLCLPALGLGLAIYVHPDLILSLVDPATAQSFETMFSPGAASIGRVRTAGTDWQMFGFYIENNIGIAFQSYVGGIAFGIGSLFFMVSNGAFMGAVAGYVANRGLSGTFFPFVATHSAFELTALVLCGAAGLRLGSAVLLPGRVSRLEAAQAAARDTSVIVFGAAVMLVIAAVLEAFWSSAPWVDPRAKYICAAICWGLVALFFLADRHAT
jgi:uncharacterized membrane protein SpoIIM required for sporulation